MGAELPPNILKARIHPPPPPRDHLHPPPPPPMHKTSPPQPRAPVTAVTQFPCHPGDAAKGASWRGRESIAARAHLSTRLDLAPSTHLQAAPHGSVRGGGGTTTHTPRCQGPGTQGRILHRPAAHGAGSCPLVSPVQALNWGYNCRGGRRHRGPPPPPADAPLPQGCLSRMGWGGSASPPSASPEQDLALLGQPRGQPRD